MQSPVTTIVIWSNWPSTPQNLASALRDDTVVVVKEERDLARANGAEVAFCGTSQERVRKLLVATPRLRWFHTPAAGVDRLLELPDFKARGIVLTNNSGSYDIQIAEHVMAFVFAAGKRLHLYRDYQARREWKEEQQEELRGETMVVFGAGSIGGEVARLASGLGMRVTAVRRREGPVPGAQRVVTTDALADVAAEADYLVVTAPLTPATRGAISRDVIARLKPTAWVINIARGAIIDEAALLESLRGKRIGGAGLDTFVEEPLPATSEFWMLPNVILTPHSSNSSPRVRERTLALFIENLRRYKAEEPLLNRVDYDAGY